MTVARTYPRWPFFAVLLAVAAIVAGSLAAFDTAPEIWQHITRYTARLSFLIFVIVFASGALAALFPSATTRWLRRNRRYTGLSFALAHFLHLFAIIALFVTIEEMPALVSIVGGGLAYVFIAAMAATSNDWSMRKLGPKLWGRLHLVGAWYVWAIFMNSYVSRLASETPPEPKWIFALTATLGFAALGLRIAAWMKKRRKPAIAAA
jgi:DMSO/TMAO reductase YedYZ heme-binding membrane subunit